MTRPERRAVGEQRERVRSELHDAVDRVLAAWPALERQARDMGRGFPSQSGGPGGVGGHSDPVARLALDPVDDPAVLADGWLADFEAWRLAGRVLVSRSAGLLPVRGPEVVLVRAPSCESCGDPVELAALKAGRWCRACYYRLARHDRSG